MIGATRSLLLGLVIGAFLLAASWTWGRHRVAYECETIATEQAREEHIRELVGVTYMSEFGVDADTARSYWRSIRRHCDHDPYLVLALIAVESRFDSQVVSAKGYRGLLQTRHTTGHPGVDIAWGCAVLGEMLDRADGDLTKAVSRYQGGSRHDNRRVLAEYARIGGHEGG
ncbi:MAG: transglycosylase SLT domain-containing protein [Nitrospirae bacterium]|nr:transglycosylase SLT domain-containing protein [Nitrospirota bacterium]